MNSAILTGLARHFLTSLGGILVARGITDTTAVEAAAGALVTLAGFAWSVFAKTRLPRP
ncbi:MAG: hypothetical protein WCO56_05215 [Verrucomicrobiota bacterium]